MRLPLLAALAPALVGGPGCGKVVSAEDCEQIGAQMREAIVLEVRRGAPPGTRETAAAEATTSTEAERQARAWIDTCRAEMMGRRYDAEEIACMKAGRSVDDFKKCTAR